MYSSSSASSPSTVSAATAALESVIPSAAPEFGAGGGVKASGRVSRRAPRSGSVRRKSSMRLCTPHRVSRHATGRRTRMTTRWPLWSRGSQRSNALAQTVLEPVAWRADEGVASECGRDMGAAKRKGSPRRSHAQGACAGSRCRRRRHRRGPSAQRPRPPAALASRPSAPLPARTSRRVDVQGSTAPLRMRSLCLPAGLVGRQAEK